MIVSPAKAIKVTVNVDDPARVAVAVNYVDKEIVAGDNQFDVEEYQSVSISAKSGAFITKVVRTQGEDSSEEYVSGMTQCNIYVSSYHEGAKWTVTSVNADEARDGSCRIHVDNASKVDIQRSTTYTKVELEDGWNDVRFMTATELPLTIGPASYGDVLYQVKVNGEQVAPQGTAWRIFPQNGDEIEVLAEFPDEDMPLTFTYASEESEGFITSVLVNDVPAEDFNKDGFTVKAGSRVTVNVNAQDYKLNSFKVNDENVSFYGSSYSFIMTMATTVAVDASKYKTVSAVVNVDNPDNIVVYKGYSYNNIILPMKEGDNEIELSETDAMIQIKPASGCFITSVTDNAGTTYSEDYSGYYNVTVTDGMVITVTSGAIERNQTAMFYIDDRSAAVNYFNFQRNDRSSIDIVSGYNEIKMYEGDNPFGLSWYGAPFANVYKNGESVSPMYSGSTTYELQLQDGDVVKVFLACDPATYKVEFTADKNVDMERIAVVSDRIIAMNDWADGFSVLQGTEVCIKPLEDYEFTATVAGKALEADAEGNYVFSADADVTVSLSVQGTGITEVESAKPAQTGIYTLQGVCVSRNADAARVSQLPAGMHIINGKKVIRK